MHDTSQSLNQATDGNNGDISREDILRQIFGDVGDLIDDFSCAVESTVLLHGRMYITNRYLCFYSNLFGLEKKIRIPYSHITAITKENTAIVIPNAIAITTYRKEYLFRSFWDRDECYRMLKEFMTRYKQEGSARRGSVPAKRSSQHQHQSHHPQQGDQASRHGSSTQRDSLDVVTSTSHAGNVTTIRTSVSSINGEDKSQSTRSIISNNNDNENEEDTELPLNDNNNNSNANASGGDGNSNAVIDQASAFREEVSKTRLKITVVNDTLDASIAEFAKLFVEDGAPYSWKKYHESVNDTNLAETPWSELSSALGKGRELKFFKPVNLPGLKCTRGTKVQRYRRFGDYGLVLCSSTRLEDVPAADTFSVEDTISVRSLEGGGGGGGGRVAVEITFEVKFIKPTMFKYVIESNTNTEMTKWLEAFHFSLKANISAAKASGLISTASPSRDAGVGGGSESIGDQAGQGGMGDSSVVKKTKKRVPKKMNPTVKKVLGRGEKLILFFDSLLERFGIVGGVVFWSAWALLVLSLLFYGWQWRGVATRIEDMRMRWGGVVGLMHKIVETQDALHASMSAQMMLIQALSIDPKASGLNGETIGALMKNLTSYNTACPSITTITSSSSSTSSPPSTTFSQGDINSLARALADISQNLKVVSAEVERLKSQPRH